MDTKSSKDGMYGDNQMMQKVIIAAVAFVIGFGVAWLWSTKNDKGQVSKNDTKSVDQVSESSTVDDVTQSPSDASVPALLPDDSSATKAPQAQVMPAKNGITVSDQAQGKYAVVSSFTLEKDGWVAIHEDKGGKPGLILGAQNFKAGEYKDQKVRIFVSPYTTIEGHTYYAMLHINDGKEGFQPKTDSPLLDDSGNPIMMKFIATSK